MQTNQATAIDRRAVSIREATRSYSIGRSLLYKLIASGELRSVKVLMEPCPGRRAGSSDRRRCEVTGLGSQRPASPIAKSDDNRSPTASNSAMTTPGMPRELLVCNESGLAEWRGPKT